MKKYLFYVCSLFLVVACDPRSPEEENEEEVINKVSLTFTDPNGGTQSFQAIDDDGDGPNGIVIDTIKLRINEMYNLTLQLENTIEGEDITTEVEEEGDEHKFLFSWTAGLMSSPSGTGNIEVNTGIINYKDFDSANIGVGLNTDWTTSANAQDGNFRVVLKHQPGIKTATSGIDNGESDIDITFPISIK